MTQLKPFEANRDKSSPNRNFSPITTETDSEGRLLVGGCILSELAKNYGTPLYVLDESSIRSACRAYRDSLNNYYPGDSLPLYASKANSSLLLSRLISSESFGLDAVSEGELLTALKGGISGDKIVLHGNNKSKDELRLAYQNGVTIVIDNYTDIDQLRGIINPDGRQANLMLRFTPGIECHTHEYIKTGHLDSKFGFDPDELQSVFGKISNEKWAKLTGLHAHIGSQIFELNPHKDLSRVMIETLLMAKNNGHHIKDLNVGGGLGVRYIQSDDPPSIDQWVKTVASAVSNSCNENRLELPRLMCEPGRSLVANAGITLYKIGSRKDIPGIRTYISVDGGMSDNPRPITYESKYTSCLADRPLKEAVSKVTIAGKHCESGDVLLKDLLLPTFSVGDVLVVFGTGAYNLSMSSNYNRIPRPASIIVNKGQADLIQKRERPEDLLQYDVIPDRFVELGYI